MKTWQVELLFVALTMATVAVFTNSGLAEWLGAGAVTLTFAHIQVADRLAEKDAARAKPSVHCHRWATRYLISKEALWLVYFVLHQSWSALVGVAIFMSYPLWRKRWRRRHPLAIGVDS